MESMKHRLVTRADLDGLACAVLMRELGLVDEVLYTHPKDLLDGKVEITGRDITANLPYAASAFLAFNRHPAESKLDTGSLRNHVVDAATPSVARIVYNYYGGRDRFPNVSEDLLTAVDKSDSAHFDIQDVLKPRGWTFLSFLMDARTGLGRFRDFRVSNHQLMQDLIDACRTLPINQILTLPDVIERAELYRHHQVPAVEQMKRCSKVMGKTVVLDLRREDKIWATNRFVIYALYPRCSLSIHMMWGLKRQNTVLALGKSILNRSSPANAGEICARFGGGGHAGAGTCQVEHSWADRVLSEMLEQIAIAEASRTPRASD